MINLLIPDEKKTKKKFSVFFTGPMILDGNLGQYGIYPVYWSGWVKNSEVWHRNSLLPYNLIASWKKALYIKKCIYADALRWVYWPVSASRPWHCSVLLADDAYHSHVYSTAGTLTLYSLVYISMSSPHYIPLLGKLDWSALPAYLAGQYLGAGLGATLILFNFRYYHRVV